MSRETIFEVVQRALGRELNSEERYLLRRLSPQGVAKLNTDILNGTDIAATLKDFKTMFAKMYERKAIVAAELTQEARVVLRRLSREATIDELTLFVFMPVSSILLEVKKRMKEGGETFDVVIEDLALEFRHKRLSTDAKTFGEIQKMPTRVNVLSPVFRPSTPNALAPNMATFRKRTIAVGLSPIVLWFKPEEQNDADKDDNSGDEVSVTTYRVSSESLPHPSRLSSLSARSSSSSSGSPMKRVSFMDVNNANSIPSSQSLPKLTSPPMSPSLLTPPTQLQPLASVPPCHPPREQIEKSNQVVGLSPTPPALVAGSRFRRRILPSLFKPLN